MKLFKLPFEKSLFEVLSLYVIILSLILPIKPGLFISLIHIICFFLVYFLWRNRNLLDVCFFKDSYFKWTFVFALFFLSNLIFYPKIEGVKVFSGLKDAGIFPLFFALLFLMIKNVRIDFIKLMTRFSILIFINATLIFLAGYFTHLGGDNFTDLVINNHFTNIDFIWSFMFSKQYAVFLAFGVFWSIIRCSEKKASLQSRFLFGLLALGNLIFLLATACRGVIISFFILMIPSLIFWLLKRMKLSPKSVIISLLVGLTFFLILFNLRMGQIYIDKLSLGVSEVVNFYEKNQFDGSWGTRIHIWLTIIAHKAQYFWTGVGAYNLEFYYNLWFKEAGIPTDLGFRSHNSYLEYFMALGIFGLLLFLIMIIFPVYKMICKRKYSVIYLFFIFLFLMINLEDTYFTYNSVIVFYGFFNYLFYYKIDELIAFEKTNLFQP